MSGRETVKTVPKPWGHETIWAHTDNYVGKILHIKAHQALSVQYHNVKDETVYLLSGELIYRVWEGTGDDKKAVDVGLEVGQSFRITPGTPSNGSDHGLRHSRSVHAAPERRRSSAGSVWAGGKSAP
jgi:mannose-6-phosphate isomerase-like protein (cupin superfamily)